MSSHSRRTSSAKRLAGYGVLGVLSCAIVAAAVAAPAQMKAIVQHGYGGPDVLKLEMVSVPEPGAEQVRVRVYAAGVNPADYSRRTGTFGRQPGAAAPSALRPGFEIAGVVDALGPGVTQVKVGEAVYGSPAMGAGGYAQYTLANVDSIAPKPRRFSFEQAAGAPVVALTAMRTIRDGNVQAGQTVVVVGAAGGVGSAVVQLAKANGAEVIAIASSQHNSYLKKLGADKIVNYDKVGAVDVKDADVVINTVPGQASAALAYVKRGGAMVSIAGARPIADQCAAAGARCPNEQGGGSSRSGPTDAEQLTELNKMVSAGKFTVHIERTFPLAQAADAQEFNHAGHAEGKVVLVMSADASKR